LPYCTATEVRSVSGLTASEISDADLTTLITYATAQLNRDIQVKIVREKVEYIDETRTNYINGSNNVFYVKSWKEYYIGDLDDDGDVDTSDVIVYLVAGDGTETTATVSAVDHEAGKITLASAPSSGTEVYITYCASHADMSTPHALVKLACSQLAAALAFTKLDVKKVQSWSVGKIRVTKPSQGFVEFYNQYRRTINTIKKFPLKLRDANKIVDVRDLKV